MNKVYYSKAVYDNRDPKSELDIKWNDNDLYIKWPLKNPIISNEDSKQFKF